MIAQGVCLEKYFYNYYKQDGWKFFICAYLPAVVLLLSQQWVETLNDDSVLSTERGEVDGSPITFKTLKRLITGYHKMFTWLLYVVPSTVQYVWILSTFADDIDSSSFFGPRFFRVILCFPSGVFLLLDTIEYAVKPELNVEWWRVFDIFDTVELLQILLVERNTSLPIYKTTTTKNFMLIFGSTSLFFPVFSLWELQACRKIPSETPGSNNSSDNKRTRLVFRVRIVSKVCQLFFVNVAFLTIRLVLFFDFNLDASVFVAKNVTAITVGVIEIISACRGKRVKRSQENMNLRSTFQNTAFGTTSDGSHDGSLDQITVTSSSSQRVASVFPNDQLKTIKLEELSPNDLSRRFPVIYRDQEKLPRDASSSMLDGISYASNTSETSLRFPSHISNKFNKTESRSTQTTVAEILSDQPHCQLCGSQKMLTSRLAAKPFENLPQGYKSVSGHSRFYSPHDTEAPESDQLSSACQKTARQEQRFLKQNPPRKFESRIYSPRGFTGSEESHALSSALQQKKTREHEHSKTETHLRENTVGLASCDDSKLAFSSGISVRESNPLSSSWQQRTTKQEKRSNTQNLAFGGDARFHFSRDTRTKELDHLYPSRLRTTTKPEESFSEMTNFRREKAAAINPRAHQNTQSNTSRREQNPEPSAFLDHTLDDNDTREMHLGFTSFSNGPKSFSEERETRPETIRQYRRHQGQRQDNRLKGRNMHTPESTVWNTRN